MIIFVDELPSAVLALSKILSAIIIVLLAFRFARVGQFLKTMVVFLFSSFVCLGVISAFCIWFKIKTIAINNSVMYFDVPAPTIIFCAFVTYILSTLILYFYNRALSQKELYTLVIENKGVSKSFVAFFDTGNKLREPFSGLPVILLQSSKAKALVMDSKVRVVPVKTVNGTSFFTSFKPDKIVIKSTKGQEKITNAYVALCDDLGDKNFSAILNCDIFSI